jgi:AcrR family transcriptional regulator
VARPALISRDAILDATLALADERGLSAVSMRGVARRLGVTPMALYHHVRNKADLLDGLVERLLAELPLPDPSLTGERRLHALASGMRQTAARHPAAFPLLLRRPVVTDAALAVRDFVYSALRDAGLAEDLVPSVERLLSTFVIGFAASEVSGRFAAHNEPVRDADFEWAWRQIAAGLEKSSSFETTPVAR